MATVHRHLLAACVAGAALLGGCSPGGGAGGPAIPADAATALAARADRVAADIDAGACDQALAEARSLEGDLAAVKADATVRAEALSRAARVVAAINCPPPTTTTTAAPAPPDQPAGPGPGHPKGKKDGHGPEHDH
ncbi:MAG TPA: hypothetical protein VFE55_03565 [Acidimicrobiia bacterium]|nr:hypothetical protein [Acidimicrobiia bacterium]